MEIKVIPILILTEIFLSVHETFKNIDSTHRPSFVGMPLFNKSELFHFIGFIFVSVLHTYFYPTDSLNCQTFHVQLWEGSSLEWFSGD